MLAGFQGIKCTVDTREPDVHLLRKRSASQHLYFYASKASSDASLAQRMRRKDASQYLYVHASKAKSVSSLLC